MLNSRKDSCSVCLVVSFQVRFINGLLSGVVGDLSIDVPRQRPTVVRWPMAFTRNLYSFGRPALLAANHQTRAEQLDGIGVDRGSFGGWL